VSICRLTYASSTASISFTLTASTVACIIAPCV